MMPTRRRQSHTIRPPMRGGPAGRHAVLSPSVPTGAVFVRLPLASRLRTCVMRLAIVLVVTACGSAPDTGHPGPDGGPNPNGDATADATDTYDAPPSDAPSTPPDAAPPDA